MTRSTLILIATVVFLGVIAVILLIYFPSPGGRMLTAALPLSKHEPFTYTFAVDGVLQEAGSPQESTSPYWWLNSGGLLILKDGVGRTIEGKLDPLDRWRVRYGVSSPTDTEQGAQPQNLFRLITRSQWQHPRTEVEFFIAADNRSESPNRNESNGVLFMSRYKDADTLYYAGVRVDGHAVIKKKYQGTYYTMAEKPIFPGEYRPGVNLLPQEVWFALRMETVTREDGVHITLLMRDGDSDTWVELLSTVDDGRAYGTPRIEDAGAVGIRTDFMDVRFGEVRIEEIE